MRPRTVWLGAITFVFSLRARGQFTSDSSDIPQTTFDDPTTTVDAPPTTFDPPPVTSEPPITSEFNPPPSLPSSSRVVSPPPSNSLPPVPSSPNSPNSPGAFSSSDSRTTHESSHSLSFGAVSETNLPVPDETSVREITNSPTGSPQTSSPVGAIAGGAVGGVVILALVGFVFFWFATRHRRRERKQRALNAQGYDTTAHQRVGVEEKSKRASPILGYSDGGNQAPPIRKGRGLQVGEQAQQSNLESTTESSRQASLPIKSRWPFQGGEGIQEHIGGAEIPSHLPENDPELSVGEMREQIRHLRQQVTMLQTQSLPELSPNDEPPPGYSSVVHGHRLTLIA
ncbi:hypothetical protein FA15DRAFT_654590 [Coprinopsis marcescibilis]|uniref:Mid2 domain-containing protein n=1 Tax=Coprinopsis marcescibilis TaxID=230819 RepID=A0A5C3KZJ2_COPMA|nr:hypothetical protein FA15DRAFT_654590 [Coprinopsis marcescibilis]